MDKLTYEDSQVCNDLLVAKNIVLLKYLTPLQNTELLILFKDKSCNSGGTCLKMLFWIIFV